MYEQSQKTTVLVADDEEFFALGVKTSLESIPAANLQVDIVYEVIEQVLDKIRENSFDVLILDLDWHDEQEAGLEVIPRIKEIKPDLPIIAISAYPKLVTRARRRSVEIARPKRGLSSQNLMAVINLVTQVKFTDRDSKQKRLRILNEHLQLLEEQHAKFGDLHVPPHIVIEIREIKQQITQLKADLDAEGED